MQSPLAVVGTVTVVVSALMDAGSELAAGSAGAAAVRAAPLAEAGEDTLDVVGLDVGELLFGTDYDNGFPMMVAESGAMSKFVRPDDGPVVALKVLADVLGDDRFSPGVSCCVILDQPVGKLLLQSVLITHNSDILLDKSDTIMDCGRSDMYLPIGPHIRIQKCGDYLYLIRIRLIVQIRATRTSVLACRGRQTASGTWNWTLTLLVYWLGGAVPGL